MNVAFQQAMVRVGVDSEGMAKQFQLVVPYTKQRGAGQERRPEGKATPPVGSAWEQLTLSHSMQWPLPILFTAPVLAKSAVCSFPIS